ncbi:UNVERIFIED_CONTAM: hypothetical protein RMT77_007436 [Armadillidium vulgare]
MANVYGGLCSVVDFVWHWCLGPVVKFPMDTLNTLLLGWLAFGVLIVLLSKFLYDKVLAWDQSEDDYNDYTNQEGAEGTRLPDEPSKSPLPSKPPPVVARKATIVPDALPEHVSAPMATGSDPDAVRWINNLLVWFFEGAEGGRIVRNAWNDSLNEYTVSSALETGVLIEVLEFYPQTPSPTLMNIIVDCSPTDDMTVTCDMETDLYMRVQTTRTQRDVTTESEYACAVRPLRGRLNVSLRTLQCVAFIKFDGWPEVKMEFEGLRNNAEGLDEYQLQEVLKEELTSALRKVTLELDFLSKKSFPRFMRERTLPETVIPVGYDALVRERQTHPPSFEPKIPASRTPVPPRSQKIPSKISADDSLVSSKTNAGILNLSPVVPLSLEKVIPQETNKSLISSDTLFTPVLKEEDLARKNIERFVYESFEKKLPSGSVSPPKENLSPKSSTDFAPGHNPVSRLSMVFSSREKPIDEFSEDTSKSRDEEDDEEDKRFLEELKKLESNKSSLVGPPPPPRNPSPGSDLTKESFKETILNNPFVKHLPESAAKSFNQAATSQLSPPVGIVGLKGKRLLVKVVKASGVGGEAGVSSCYSVIEMDDPAQKFTTSVVNDTNSPFWDEQFLFDLSDNTLELLFELYDKSDGRFVGLGIVGIEELVATPSQRQIIPLQPRPYEKDEVTGSLTCEFLFLDRADLPDIAFRKPKKPLTLETDKIKSTTKTYTILPDEKNTEEEEEDMGGMSGSVGVAEAVLKDLKEKPNGSPLLGPNTRSTVIIHSSRKLEGVENEDDENYKPGVSDEFGTGVVSSGTASSSGHHQSRLGTQASVTTANTAENTHDLEGQSSTLEIPTDGTVGVSSNGLEDERGRSRSRRKRDFFGSLRRRFSRSKLRSKSVDPTSGRVDIGDVVTGGRRDVSLDRDPLAGRSVSMERSASRLSSYGRSRGKSLAASPTIPDSHLPNSGSYLHLLRSQIPKFIRGRSSPSGGTGVGSGDSESTRSSLSGTSGLSSASAKTYINEASILVVETLENGVIKHYLVPLSLQRKNKWKKKGTKLHIYNEHTFVAKHMSSSISCQVCQKGMGRRLGKQGYECRDCSYKCHKPCHVKTDIICPNSTINSMDLVYVKDDKANNKNSRLNS